MKRYLTQLILTTLFIPGMLYAMQSELQTQPQQKQAELTQVTEALARRTAIDAELQKAAKLNAEIDQIGEELDKLNTEIQEIKARNEDVQAKQAQHETLYNEGNQKMTECDAINVGALNQELQEHFLNPDGSEWTSERLAARKAELDAELVLVNLPRVAVKQPAQLWFFEREWDWLANTRPARLVGRFKNFVWPKTKAMNTHEVRTTPVHRFELTPQYLQGNMVENAMTLRSLRFSGSDRTKEIKAASYARGTRLALLALGCGAYLAYRQGAALTQVPSLSGVAKAAALFAGGYVATKVVFPKMHIWWYNTSHINALARQCSRAVKATGVVTNEIAENAHKTYVGHAGMSADKYKAKREKMQAYFKGMVATPRPAQS